MGGSFTDSDALDFMIQTVDSTLKQMTGAAASLGSLNSRIDTQTSFVSKLMDSIDSGVGKLVDANMEQESSKLSALQTQQQLGHPVAVDRQLLVAEHPVALPLRAKQGFFE